MDYYARMLKLFRRVEPDRRDAVMEFAAFLLAHRQDEERGAETLSAPGPISAQCPEVRVPETRNPPD